MLGSVAFMVRGNMATGVSAKGQLMVRVSPAKVEELVADPQAHPMAQGAGVWGLRARRALRLRDR